MYIDTDADLRLIRRLQPRRAERGRTPESIIAQYLATVRPSHEQFIEPSKRYADVIFPQGGLNEPALDVLLARVEQPPADGSLRRRGPPAAGAQRLTKELASRTTISTGSLSATRWVRPLRT